MGKLGKKARKFAKKNLQSVLKRQRKVKSFFKKKASKRDERAQAEDSDEEREEKYSGRNNEVEDFKDISLDAVFGEDGSDMDGDDSDSDGYLSEDTSCSYNGETRIENHLEEYNGGGDLSVQNKEIHLELAKKMKRLSNLKAKDPEFAKFLESNKEHLQTLRDEENQFSDEEESDEDGRESTNKMGNLSSSTFDSLCELVKEQNNVPAFVRLLNGYRAACHYGSESPTIVEDSHTFCKILTFMLQEADNIFRKILGISGSNDRKEAILELKNTSKWKTLKPVVKSYLRSTLFLLNVVTDSQILAFALTRLKASIVFFAAFPPLLGRLIKISVHLWATGKGTLSACSLLIIKDVAVVFNSNCFETCMIKAYKAIIDHCKFVEPVLFKHQQFLKSSFIELCSQDLQKAYSKAMVSIQQLAKILQLGLRTKKEAVKKICSWQYANSVDLWVAFISLNIHDYDLQPLLYTIIQIINGVAVLFPGPRYMPLRVKCIQWLNTLSESSGVFIPVTSLVLDILEYKIGKESSKPGKDFSFSSAVKLPKHWLKSRNFQDECVFSAIELLAVHFAQWSYHISFPELATIPLIYLRKFHEMTTIESLRRVVKRFIDQVEQNIEFVRKKRDEVTFSPNDQQSVESFLQLEKCGGNAPFTKYYTSVIEKAGSRNLLMNGKISFLEQKKTKGKRQQTPKNAMNVDLAVNAEGNSH
ncbi:PREDICTED: nucleolar complex protein 2 homolog isoform X1 [Populus euphratica]|uniref:Nucleolar complex protein 2 homolog isoform X1 n=1 Tax=Populus euphratica TaxID=75702 RepID=A0AAJ6URG4_POPEU|nr:PREDICTED: nucleolar complex protein 2 homolog isoform X1 [Populus euphratica]XP_011026375.1 PREDICTED: nucleolar complex protein 2 homolog isoform X1 [Populus euphratica]XP_011031789.1 PREDICTED: nucleolar complex protein 2 homolog isoform X1 [Populus euphratica]XP_011031790.1 PREDICTED: nucleolar complex protein 2 homolog isoform X1 [Populus euphratica]XP_011031791.1 PREDICTED: nucleolar complex protein 2 homolog isoform X1 [Populus euphratica]XP_011033916.1 PREDICTED: nucleolar complex p